MKNGKHLIVDAYDCDRDALWDADVIERMLKDVTTMIGLKPLSEALIYEVDESMIEKKDTGITGGIIFMESHFTFHSFPEQKYFSADIYSCNDFEHLKVVEYINSLFTPDKLDINILRRGQRL